MRNIFKTAALAAMTLTVISSFTPAQTKCADDDYTCKVTKATREISDNPGNYESYYNRGVAYKSLKQYDSAISDLTRYIRSDPSNKEYLADGYFQRGNCYYDQGNFENAVVDYSMAIRLSPTTSSYIGRGNSYISLSEYVKAIEDYNRAIAIDVKSAEAYYNRSRAYYKQKLYAKAIADLDIYITLNKTNVPFLADGYWNRANSYEALGNLNAALKDINFAIGLEPDRAGMYTSRAGIYRKLGKVTLAVADERKAATYK